MHEKNSSGIFASSPISIMARSTLADRFIEKAHLVDQRKMQNQMLDNMDIERERASP